MRTPQPVFTAHLFAPLHEELVHLLRGLSASAWDAATAAGSWTVRDVAAHLLDTMLRRIASIRDGYLPSPPAGALENGLAAFINALNRDWVAAARRLSPQMLVELHALYGPALAAAMTSVNPLAPAPFGVSWAGEESSPGWFDVARELTEQWHHQQQIRDAVGAPSLVGSETFSPVMDTFMRALPFAYRDLDAPPATALSFHVTECRPRWTLVREGSAWTLWSGEADDAACHVTIEGDAAWRLFTKGLTPEKAEGRIQVRGEKAYAEPLLRMICIVA